MPDSPLNLAPLPAIFAQASILGAVVAECVNIDLGSAAQIWWSGTKLDAYCIEGLSTVWIGRLAKLIGFLSAIPLLIDLIGEDRIDKSLQRFRQTRIALSRLFPEGLDKFTATAVFGQSLIIATLMSLGLMMAWYIGRISTLWMLIAMVAMWAAALTAFFITLQLLRITSALVDRALVWSVRIVAALFLATAFLIDLFVAS